MTTEEWAKLLSESSGLDEASKVRAVNDFFNRVPFKADGDEDKWLSPEEFLKAGQGDCEDYAIAKYASLRKLGVPAEKLRLSYMTLDRGIFGREPHMVLLYDNQVLDNLNQQVVPLAERSDLKDTQYQINEAGTWARRKNSPELVQSQQKLGRWMQVLGKLGLSDQNQGTGLINAMPATAAAPLQEKPNENR